MDETQNGTAPSMRQGGFSAYVIAALALLTPLFFIPSATYPFQFSKVALALVAAIAVFVAFSITTLRSGRLSFVWSRLMLPLLILPLAYLIASIFSPVPSLSLFGYQLDPDTFGFMALAAALSLATIVAVKSERQIFRVLFWLLIAGWIAFVFQAIQIFFNDPILPSLFTSPTVNLVGSWNDFALFAALIASMVLLAFESLQLSTLARVLLGVTVLFALFVLAAANFSLAWYLLGAVAFVLMLFAFMRRFRGTDTSAIRGIASLVTLAIAVFFVFFGSGLSSALQSHFHLQALDVRPSIQGTIGILETVYGKNALVGSGPDLFSQSWLASRPAQVLSTPFWNTEFTSGFGAIPTSMVTGGIVVALAWLFLIGFFGYLAVRALLTVPAGGDRSYFLVTATALASAFLFVAHIFYAPSEALTILLFVFLGLFMATLASTRLSRRVEVAFADSPRLGLVSLVCIAVLLVLSLVSLYGTGVVYASAVQEGKAITLSNAGKLDPALAAATSAAQLSGQDRYYRTLTSLYLAKLSNVVATGATDQNTQSQFTSTLSAAINAATAAVTANPVGYDNYLNRASVYEAIVPLNVQGAADQEIAALEAARKLNPNSPEIDYHEALLKEYAKDTGGAETLVTASLQKMSDYTPSILLYAQIALDQGNIANAEAAVKAAASLTQDATLYYQLGLLELSNKQYADAASSFQTALSITPNFANASFFLGESEVFLGQKDQAMALFSDLATKNPSNATLEAVIQAMQKGQNPFATSTPATPPSQATVTPAP